MMKLNRLPQTELRSVAHDLRIFLDKKRIPQAEVNAITLTSYDDAVKWEATKEQITAAVDVSRQEGWDAKPLEQWSVEDTLRWLTDKNLSKYCTAFKENDMDGQTMMELNETDLRDLGITSIGHRKTFMRHLGAAKNASFAPEEVLSNNATPPLPSDILSNNIVDTPSKEQGWNSIIIRGLPSSLLEDEDTLFDIENLAFTGFLLDSFTTNEEGIVVTFEKPLKVAEKG